MYTLFDDNKTFVLGHRGFSEQYPENTMLSFEKCAEDERVDGIELDVHICKSGELVVAHDSNLTRVASIDCCIENMTWNELKDIDVGSFKGSEFSFCRMPLLTEVFERFGNRFIYDIEIKATKRGRYKKLCKQLWAAISDFSLEEKVMVSSFNPFALRFFNKVCVMSIPTGDIYNVSQEVPKFLQKGKGHIISHSSFSKPEHVQVNEGFLSNLNMDVITWSVNKAGDAKRLLMLSGVKGLIGNNPIILAEIREKLKK